MGAPARLGVSRNLTDVFSLLRNNAQQARFTRKRSSRTIPEEEMSLVSLEEGTEHYSRETEQPLWIHTADEVEFEIGRIRTRINELTASQLAHLSRPAFGEEHVEEKKIETTTAQITSMISHAQRLVHMTSSDVLTHERNNEVRLRENVMNALIFSLSQLTSEFKKHQTEYLNKIRKRTQNVDAFVISGMDDGGREEIGLFDSTVNSNEEYSMEQLQSIIVNDNVVKEREKEVLAVNNSIVELNSLFKDLSSMVIDQGTILDRIDHNIEQSSIRVSRAVEAVTKAERHQRADKKMHCILCLSISIILVLLLIVFIKF